MMASARYYWVFAIVLVALGLISGIQWGRTCRNIARSLRAKHGHAWVVSALATIVLIVLPCFILWNHIGPDSRPILAPFLAGLIAAEVFAQVHGAVSAWNKRQRPPRDS